MKSIKKTSSRFTFCNKDVKSEIIEDNNKIFLIKHCKSHKNKKILLSSNSKIYENLLNNYSPLNFDKNNDEIYYNLDISSLPKTGYKKFLNEILKDMHQIKIGIWGKEPTDYEILPKIINIIKQSKNIPALYTDGIHCADFVYISQLKKIGLNNVYITIEGLTNIVYQKLYKKNTLEYKIKALKNLRKLNISTSIRTPVIKGINDDELLKIIELSIKYTNVKCLMFQTEYFKKSNSINRITIEEIIDILNVSTNNRISNTKILSTQILMYSIFNALNIKKAFCNRDIPILRNNNIKNSKFIFEMINTKKIANNIREYKKIKHNTLSKLFLFTAILININSTNVFFLIPLIAKIIKGKILGKRTLLSDIGNDILLLSFIDPCTNKTYDSVSRKNCPLGEITYPKGINKSLAKSIVSNNNNSYMRY